MKHLGLAKKILRMEISRNRRDGILLLFHEGYIKKALDMFGIIDAKPISTLIAQHFKLRIIRPEENKE